MFSACSPKVSISSSIKANKATFHSSRVLSILHHEWVGAKNDDAPGDENETLLFLHGLLGNCRNLKTLAKKIVSANNQGSFKSSGLLMDLRGHGRSNHGKYSSEHHTFDSCIDDIHATLETQATPSLVMGHSWGGRLALQYVHSLLSSSSSSSSSLPSLWLLDTVPGQAHDSVLRVLDAVQRIDFCNKTRQDVAKELEEYGLDRAIAQWLASTLQQDKETKLLVWGFDVNVVKELMPEFQNQDFVGMLQDVLADGASVKLIKGGLNKAWEDSPRILTQLNELEQMHPHQFEQHTLPKAGHWVHVDDLPGLLNIVKERSVS
jgi:pimeloyl-ACP methyl ester carboxylesterase